eukprot:13963698-Ditylum_brightwellii.AAC.1
MDSISGHIADDLYGEDESNGIVQKLCNHIMHLKGLNPSITTDLASLQPLDYEVCVESVATCTDKVLENVNTMFQCVSVSFNDQLNFQHDNKLWDHTESAPFNGMTKVYFSAVLYHQKLFQNLSAKKAVLCTKYRIHRSMIAEIECAEVGKKKNGNLTKEKGSNSRRRRQQYQRH